MLGEGVKIMDNKFKMDQRVFLVGKPFYVTGVRKRFSAAMIYWEYWITNAMDGDHPPESFGTRCDVESAGPIHEEQLQPVDQWNAEREKYLSDEVEKLQAELAALKKARDEFKDRT